MLVNVATT